MTNEALRWGPIETCFGNFAAWVDERGRLVRFRLNARDAARYDRDARRDDAAVAAVAREVDEYCDGGRRRFTLELAARGTPFQQRVWDALVEIPYGETMSYGALAKQLGCPGGARAVGLANGNNPIGLIVPCHRVIGADGSLTGYGGGLPLKRALLAFEAEPRRTPVRFVRARRAKRLITRFRTNAVRYIRPWPRRPGRRIAAAHMGHELVHHVEFRHFVENLDEARSRIALVADEEQARIILHALAPGRPALGGEIHAVIVGIGPPQNSRAVIARVRLPAGHGHSQG